MKYGKMFATVRGTTCEGEAFTEEIEFTLIPPKDNNHYGTGFYMNVERQTKDYPKPMVDYVDVRYERTTDIEILADRWIKGYYGANAKEVEKTFPKED